ncbi:2-carboxy-D-arabinitol-1-phosphatase-like [Phragmites australis]|uniref:2-carboxy-D-arabinitol-1-phosphatase-like n=1 Tax=Phragmites australis TaxID=29695 RepID=UPI002D767922|nr:2-carboxy-D-arabinitol-1-phosphatase-like [Phragmites australis]
MLLLTLAPPPSPAAAGRRRLGRSVRCSGVHELERSPSPHPGASLPPLREAKRVVLVRHGQSTWNAEGRIQGSSNTSVLTPKGESQAETSRQMLLSDSFDACFTSPLARSHRTAEIIWEGRDEDLTPDSDLREIDLYSFQGLLKHEGKERYGVQYLQWQKNAANFSIDGHYPVRELWDRAQNCWERILAHEGKSVLVVAHNAVNQALVATSLGLGAEYFRILLQSNCGASVLDFTPQTGGGPPGVCLNRLNQTPYSPVAGSPGGRKTSKRIILACQGATQNSPEISLAGMGYAPLNMLGIIQSQKIAELLLDLKVNSILCSPQVAAVDTATAICEVQEAADCLGADCVPRYVERKSLLELEIDDAFQTKQKSFGEIVQSGCRDSMEYKTLERLWAQSKDAWQALLNELPDDSTSDRVLVAVGHPAIHLALICQCLNLPMEYMSSFHLDDGSISVIDFPDGPKGRGVVRCTNYTAHLGRWSIPITRPTENDEEF